MIFFPPFDNFYILIVRYGIVTVTIQLELINPFPKLKPQSVLQPECFKNICAVPKIFDEKSYIIFYEIPDAHFEASYKLA